MDQARTLSVDYGIENGRQLYAGSSTTFYVSTQPMCKTEQFLQQRHAAARMSAYVPFSWSTGAEYAQRFVSTERERPIFNECTNEKTEGYQYTIGISYEHYTRPWVINLFPYWVYQVIFPTADRNFVRSGQSLGSSVWSAADAARRRAWWEMQPRFEGRVDLLNALFELKDFRDIAKSALRFNIRDIASEMRHLRGTLERAKADLGLKLTDKTVGDLPRIIKGLDSTTRGLAALYLTKELAFDPTVADCLAIQANLARTATQAQAAFKKAGLSPQRMHYRETLFDDVSSSPISAGMYWMEHHQTSRCVFNATMEYLYSYKNRPPMAAFRKYWGLDLNAEVVWNALPLTWVMDYFITIGDSIHRMSADPAVDLTVTQYCESILYEREAGHRLAADPRIAWAIIDGKSYDGSKSVPLQGLRYSFYQRRVGEPDRGAALPQVKLPNFGQLSNLIALLRCWL